MSRRFAVWGLAALAACGSSDPSPVPSPVPSPTTLMAPQLRAPVSNAYVGSLAVPASLAPTFQWTPIAGATPATTYELDIATDAMFAHMVQTITTAGTSVTLKVALPVSHDVPVGARYFWRVRSCDDSRACSAFSAPHAFNLGRSATDFNGDGLADVVIGSPYGMTGLVSVYFGGAGTSFDANPGLSFTSPDTGDQFGLAAVFVGDVNNDGFADLVVGAPNAESQTGAAYLYLGGPSGHIAASPAIVMHGEPGELFGSAIADAGDVDGDGIENFAIVSTGGKVDSDGAMHVFFPAADGSLSDRIVHGGPNHDRPVVAVAGLGDVNGDGLADIGVTINNSTGNSGVVFFGDPAGTLDVSAALATSGILSIAGGDVNGDGLADVVVTGSEPGTVQLYLGNFDTSKIAGQPITYNGPDERFGNTLVVRDVDGDGFADIVISDDARTVGALGGVYVFPGGVTPSQTSSGKLVSASPNQSLWSVSSPGDVNGDGIADLVIDEYGDPHTVLVYAGHIGSPFAAPPLGGPLALSP
jgi:hypothetical protein